MTIQDSVRREPGAKYNPLRNVGGVRQSAAVPGTHLTKTYRNFKWLPWYAGDISETPLTAHDILTGPMSGCMLVTYRRNGVTQAGHVGTVDDPDGSRTAVNNSVKTLWNQFANAHAADVIGGFDPVDAAVPNAPAAQPGDMGGKTWGLFTTSGLFYAVHVQVQQDLGGVVGIVVPTYRIVGVHLVQSKPLNALQNI
jgi:hypothetical protein